MATFPSNSIRTKNWGNETLTDSDLEGEFDVIHTWLTDAMNSSTGHKHDGTANEGPKILTANIDDSAGTAGDIYTNTSGTTVGRVAIGTAKQLLAVNSGATAPEWVNLAADDMFDGSVVAVSHTSSAAQVTGTTTMPLDDTIPQNTEGFEVLTQAHTAASATNKLTIIANILVGGVDGHKIAALFIDSTAGALAATSCRYNSSDGGVITLTHDYTPGDTSSHTYKIRIGSATAGTLEMNGALNGTTGRFYGGVASSTLTIIERVAS